MCQLAARVGRRGAALLVFAFVDVSIGTALLSPAAVNVPTYVAIQHVAPLWAWGGLWLAVAGVLAVSAFTAKDRIAFSMAIGIKILWALGYLFAQFMYSAPRAWLGAAVWITVALLVAVISGWPEPPRGRRVDPE